MLRRLFPIAVACAIVGACSRFDEGDPASNAPPDGAAGDADASATPVEAGDAGSAPPSCGGDAHTFCEDFDDTRDGIAAFPRWFAVRERSRLERVNEGATSAPFALRVTIPMGATNEIRPYLETVLPTPTTAVTCAADLRIVESVGKNVLEVGIIVEGAPGVGDTTRAAALFFLGGATREVGVYQDLGDGGADYVGTLDTPSIPQTTNPVRTTFRLDLSSPARATISWPGGSDLSHALSGKLPATITKVLVRFGGKSLDAASGALDVRYDDIFCDVE